MTNPEILLFGNRKKDEGEKTLDDNKATEFMQATYAFTLFQVPNLVFYFVVSEFPEKQNE